MFFLYMMVLLVWILIGCGVAYIFGTPKKGYDDYE